MDVAAKLVHIRFDLLVAEFKDKLIADINGSQLPSTAACMYCKACNSKCRPRSKLALQN
jgi:hypothetical protein